MGDAYFGSRENRAAPPQLLDRGNLGADVESAILRGMNARISVEVIGQTGRPQALRVTVVDDAQTAAQERMTEQTDHAASGVIIGSLPTMGRGPEVWQFEQDDSRWRGTAQIGSENGCDVALSCTKPEADPTQYPGGGHIRPHEAGVYTLYVSPSAIGTDYSAPGAGTYMLELSIDEQARGAAPVIMLASEMKLATIIPVAHPFIEGLRTGAKMRSRARGRLRACLQAKRRFLPLAHTHPIPSRMRSSGGMDAPVNPLREGTAASLAIRVCGAWGDPASEADAAPERTVVTSAVSACLSAASAFLRSSACFAMRRASSKCFVCYAWRSLDRIACVWAVVSTFGRGVVTLWTGCARVVLAASRCWRWARSACSCDLWVCCCARCSLCCSRFARICCCCCCCLWIRCCSRSARCCTAISLCRRCCSIISRRRCCCCNCWRCCCICNCWRCC